MKKVDDFKTRLRAAASSSVAPTVTEQDYAEGAMVHALDRDNIGFITGPAGPHESYVEFHNTETGRQASVKIANAMLEVLAPPSERQARIKALPVGADRVNLEREEKAAREGLAAFNATEVPDAVLGVGAHVKAPGVKGYLGKTGFVESIDGAKALVRYYDAKGYPSKDLEAVSGEKLKVLASPSSRMALLAKMPDGAPRDEVLRKEQEYRKAATSRVIQQVQGKGNGQYGRDFARLEKVMSDMGRDVPSGLTIQLG